MSKKDLENLGDKLSDKDMFPPKPNVSELQASPPEQDFKALGYHSKSEMRRIEHMTDYQKLRRAETKERIAADIKLYGVAYAVILASGERQRIDPTKIVRFTSDGCEETIS